MATFADGLIEAYLGPAQTGAPDDLEQVIIDFIAGAQNTLKIAVQELDSEAIAQAILDARWRGVRVQMFLEQDYLIVARESFKDMVADAQDDEQHRVERQWFERDENRHAINRKILGALLRSGVDVKADFNPNIFHQKFIIRDYTTRDIYPPPAVLTGSTNFTITGTHRNLNHIVIFHDQSIARRYNSEFRQIRAGQFGRNEGGLTSKPRSYNIAGKVPVRILFAPDHAPELEVIKQMLKARDRMDFAIFTFSGSSGIDDAMVMLNRANIKIRGVLDRKQANQKWSARHWLQKEGIEFYFPDGRTAAFRGKLGKLHHKLMVIDEDIVIGGSMNYTGPANDFNDENIFVIGSPYDLDDDEGGPVDHEECARIARFFRTEIDRIIENSVAQHQQD